MATIIPTSGTLPVKTEAEAPGVSVPATPGGPILINDNSGSAADRLAKITRAEWEEQKGLYRPYEDKLLGLTSYQNPGMIAEQAGEARTMARDAFEAAKRGDDTALSRYGIQRTAAEDAERSAGLGLRQSLSEVDAMNWTIQRLADRDKEIMLGGINVGVK